MAGNYAQLLDIINNPTNHSLPAWDNNNKLIEGLTVKQYLLTIIQSLTAGYQFMGVATPSTSPGTPDQNVFYIGGAGTYANFGTSITVRQGQICVFKWNGSWTNTPIEVAETGFLNVNDVNGRATEYGSASAARLDVPTTYRKSGLTITYLLSTGWIIEQNLDATAETWADNASWQSIGPVSVSQNTLMIGGEKKAALPDDYIESTEWAFVITDKVKRVLEGITVDLKKIFFLKTIFKEDITIKGLIRGKKGATIEKELELDGEIFKVVSSDEWSIALIDKSGRVAVGIRKNGKLVVYGGIESHNENLPEGLKEIKYTEVLNGTFNYASTFINWQKCYLFPVSVGKIYKITNSINQEVNYAILKDNTPALSDVFHCKSLMDKDAEVYVPSDGAYLYIDCAYIDYIKVYETEKTYDIDKSNIKNRLIYSINKSLRYTFNVVIPNRYPGFDTITNFGGNTEVYIRPMAQVCFTLGTQIYNNTYDALSTGHTIYDAKKQLVRLVNSIANYYIYWGHQWQSALWAYYIGVGCILNRDLFTDAEYEQVVHCIETEADFQVENTDLTTLYWMDNNDQPYYNAGDTKLEEVDWNNAVVGLAALVTTDDEKRQAYRSKFVELCCIGQSMPGDYQSGKVVNGYPLSELQGYNVRADGVAINNGIVHPGYSLDAYCSLFGTVACMMYLGKLVPKAVWFNQDKITHALTNRDFTQAEGYNPPYGTIYKAGTNDIYYPQGHDWGLVLGITQASADIICNLLGLHPDEDWETWGNLHLNRVLRFQDRNESGKYYEDGENYLAPEYYENETYEPTKLCVALAFILNPLFEDDSDWYNVE